MGRHKRCSIGTVSPCQGTLPHDDECGGRSSSSSVQRSTAFRRASRGRSDSRISTGPTHRWPTRSGLRLRTHGWCTGHPSGRTSCAPRHHRPTGPPATRRLRATVSTVTRCGFTPAVPLRAWVPRPSPISSPMPSEWRSTGRGAPHRGTPPKSGRLSPQPEDAQAAAPRNAWLSSHLAFAESDFGPRSR